MNWNQMTIGKKIGLGFGLVLLLLFAVGLLSYNGVGSIVHNAKEVIEGHKLDGLLAQKEVDHLNWINQVNALLTDDKIHTLSVETDPEKCGFGQWLHGEGRKQAEQHIPELIPLLKAIEGPHKQLHESAVEIGRYYHAADDALPGFLAAKESDHLKWAAKIDTLFIDNLAELNVETDPNHCELGQWLNSDKARDAANLDPEIAALLEAIKKPHQTLHQSAMDIKNAYQQIHPGLIEVLMKLLDDHRLWAAAVSDAIITGQRTIDVEMDPEHCAFGVWMKSDEATSYMTVFPLFQSVINRIIMGIAFEKQNIAFVVGLAFAIAASANFPILFLSMYWKKLTTRGAVIGGTLGLATAVILVILGPIVWVQILGNAEAIFPYKYPALFSVVVAFVGIWFFSITDNSEDAKNERELFEAQYIRSQTGIGAEGAVEH